MNGEYILTMVLKNVKYPGFDKDIISLGLVKEVKNNDGAVRVVFLPMNCDDKMKQVLREAVTTEFLSLPGMEHIEVHFDAAPTTRPIGRQSLPPKQQIPGIAHIIPIASGKGGVGKSTVAVNLAAALSLKGLQVGILDLDLYGPSIPMMMGLQEMPAVTPDKKMQPLEKFDLTLMSVGFFLEEDSALIWRGPMVMKMARQFLPARCRLA